MRRARSTHASRAEVAAIAARALVDGSARDYDDARRRALRESGVEGKRATPDNQEIHRAVVDYLELFHGAAQRSLIARLRATALRGLAFFACFGARLSGAVWDGTASAATPISLHLFSDEPEAVTRFLLERGIDYELGEVLLRFPGTRAPQRVPQFAVELGGEVFTLTVFPSGGACRHPLSALDDRPVKRVGERELSTVIASGELFPDDRPLPR